MLPGQQLHFFRSLAQGTSGRFQRQGKQNGEIPFLFADPPDGVGPVPHDRQDGSLDGPVQGFLREGNRREEALGEHGRVRPRIGLERPGESVDELAEDDPRIAPGPGKCGLRHGGRRLGE